MVFDALKEKSLRGQLDLFSFNLDMEASSHNKHKVEDNEWDSAYQDEARRARERVHDLRVQAVKNEMDGLYHTSITKDHVTASSWMGTKLKTVAGVAPAPDLMGIHCSV